ncbi:MAG: hypothetical protein A2Y39_06955 [Candidatus Delongbacteria bacterium GWF2_40_14]|nr:MAG: hypothetical protein A2Y39_06955 [Candidatus Delongbacteria bacterium GWF2_40_14]
MRKYILLLFVLAVLLHSTTYYLSNSGNNSNNGTSTSTPWRTISTLDSALIFNVISQNDSILFNRGDRFFGQVDLTDSGIAEGLTFSSYSTGNKPIIDGSIAHFVLDSTYWDASSSWYVYNFSSSMPDSCKIINVALDSDQLIFAREPDISFDENDLPVDNYFTITSWVDSTCTLGASGMSESFSDYIGADLVYKESKSWYDSREILSGSGTQCVIEEDNDALGGTMLNYGFFLQNDSTALDTNEEWYVCYDANGKPERLYFKTDSSNEGKTLYITGYDNNDLTEYGNGFYIMPPDVSDGEGSTIESLDFRNMRECIMIGRAGTFNSAYLYIQNNDFSNALVGVDNFYNQHITLTGNSFLNINTFGVISYPGDYFTVDDNDFENIGLILGYDRRLFSFPTTELINLVAVHINGDYNTVKNSTIQNVGYSAIKFGAGNKTGEEKGRAEGINIDNNTIDHALHTFADGSGIYSWHTFGDPDNKNRITNNTITDCKGCNTGTPTNYDTGAYQGDAIYLDELACNVKMYNNSISDCSGGIVAQIGRGYEITSNTITNCREYNIMINNGGLILNGGEVNPNDSTDFSCSQSTSGDWEKNASYYWNAVHKTAEKYPIDGKEFAYVEPGDIYIDSNYVSTGTCEKSPAFFNFIFGTWREIDGDFLENYMGAENPISNNVDDSKSNISVYFYTADVRYSDGTINKVGRVCEDTYDYSDTDFYGTGNFKLGIFTGTKSEYEEDDK